MARAYYKVKIVPDVLIWVIENSNFNIMDLYAAFPKIDAWISGKEYPSFDEIESLSRKLSIPIGFFFLEERPELDPLYKDFRTIKNQLVTKPSRELIDTLEDMDRKRNWMREYRMSINFPQIDFIGSINENYTVEDTVEKIRSILDLPVGWNLSISDYDHAFREVRLKLEDAGVLVMLNGIVGNNTHRKLNINEFRAFALADKYAPLIFINNADSKGAKLFSLFHEFCHLLYNADDLLHETAVLKAQNKFEKTCNRVAAEILAPTSYISEQWDINREPYEQIKSLSRKCKASEIVIAVKAIELSLIDQDQLDLIVRQTIEAYNQNLPSGDGGDFYNTKRNNLSYPFTSAVISRTREGKTIYTEAYRLLGLRGHTFDHFVGLSH